MSRKAVHLGQDLIERLLAFIMPAEDPSTACSPDRIDLITWDSVQADELWTQVCGKGRWLGMTDKLEHHMHGVADVTLWEFRQSSRASLVPYARERLARQLAASGASANAIERVKHRFNPFALTLGFARRFASYKRPGLLLHDPARLLRLLSDRERPVQLIVAGKAHPADSEGQALIQGWTRYTQNPEFAKPLMFLADYDVLLAEPPLQGVGVWINNPRRPWEASGTSGMKVLVN